MKTLKPIEGAIEEPDKRKELWLHRTSGMAVTEQQQCEGGAKQLHGHNRGALLLGGYALLSTEPRPFRRIRYPSRN